MSKKSLLIFWLLTLLSAVGALFWYQDWVYQLPTPIPKAYKPVPTQTLIELNHFIALQPDKPVFLHFFNPDCPCSRFNRPHFTALVREFGHQVNFVIVLMSTKPYSPQQIQEKVGLNLPVLVDPALASVCGVYSTPQAVLLDTRHRLYYRGNYNRSRYCTDQRTSYAKIALTQLLLTHADRVSDSRALTAYGCSLPSCKTQHGL